MRRSRLPAISEAARSIFQGRPSSLANTFAVPAGSKARGIALPASPFTTSFRVPSPPQTITICLRSRTARRASSDPEPGPSVGANSESIPWRASTLRARSTAAGPISRARPAVGLKINSASRIGSGMQSQISAEALRQSAVASIRFLQYPRQDIRDFKQSAIAHLSRVAPKLCKRLFFEQLCDRVSHRVEIRYHQADLFLAHPRRVIPLLRQSPGIPLYDHRQAHRQRFGNASGPRFADEKIGKLHVVGDVGGEPFDQPRYAPGLCTQLAGQALILPANQDQPNLRPGFT